MWIEGADTSQKVVVVAEIGNNHEGSASLAKEMIDLAADAGVNAVKFQAFLPEYLSGGNKARGMALSKFHLTIDELHDLALFAREKRVVFFATPFDLKTADELNRFQSVFKIASSDNDFVPLIEQVAKFDKPIIMSTGFLDINQIKKVEARIRGIWKRQNINPGLALLHCVSSYPTLPVEVNLLSIRALGHQFSDCEIGYSDHSVGINAMLGAVALGARIVEKHFTMDKKFSSFRDHALSADPKDMRELVSRIREIEVMVGKKKKEMQPCERANEAAVRRSAAASRDLSINHVLRPDDLIWVRPGTGVSWNKRDRLIGFRLKRTVKYAQLITERDVE